MARLSIVSTLYRSAVHLEEFHRRITAAASAVTDDYEIILVNDGSPDDSLAVGLALLQRDARLRVIDLARNFGHHKAMMTGLAHARGDLVFLIDSDLEEEPELLGAFLHAIRQSDADVVYGVQAGRRGGLVERVSGWIFFQVFNLLSASPIPPNLVTVRLMTRRYVSALVQHRERETMIAGLWVITGFRQIPLVVNKHARAASTYGLGHKLAILVNSVTSFSDKPLVFIFYLGTGIVALATAAAGYLVVRRLFFGELLAGWPSLIVSVWLLGGLTLFALGIIGIYLSKVFLETKQRPYTIIREIHERPTPESRTAGDPGDRRPVLL
jgi:putative glycosyltransferase